MLIILCAILCAACISCKSGNAPEESSESSSLPEESSTPAPEESTPEPESEVEPEEHEHVFLAQWDKNDLYHWHTCDICGADNDITKHEMEIIVVNKEPTADAPGEGVYVCIVCGAVEMKEIPVLGIE